MPYIKRFNEKNGYDIRKGLQDGERALNAGELNYQIFYYIKHNCVVKKNVIYGQVKAYVDNFLGEKPNYQKYNDITGCLVRCYREIFRRLEIRVQELIDIRDSYDDEIAKYEDTKIEQNGDVE